MKRNFILGTLILSAFLVGCGEASKKVENNSVSSKQTIREVLHVEEDKSDEFEFETSEFNLGSRTYERVSGKAMPYELRGIITLPKSDGKKPLVIAIHGSHDNENENVRFDTGFTYLLEKLGMNNYIGVALDIQPAYVWKYGDNDDNEKIRAMFKEFIEALKADENISNNIDFENIVLVGLSRGADTILDIANENENIKGILSVAPAISVREESFVDIRTSIVVPEYDGDVISLDGISIFDTIINTEGRISDVDLIILEKAGHNAFNSNIDRNDVEILGNERKLEMQLDREEQERFLGNLAIDFMDSIFKEENNGLYEEKALEPTTMYGLGVKTRSWKAEGEIILNKDNFEEAEGEKIELTSVKESQFYKYDETQGFKLPITSIEEKDTKLLLNARWESEGAKIIVPLEKDLSQKEALVISLALDSSDDLNNSKGIEEISVELRDKKGNKSKIIIDEETKALSYVEGKMDMTEIFEDKYYFWDSYTPLSMIRIPMNLFEGVTLEALDNMSISFDNKETGAIMIEEISAM
ncbi:hypothetical protein [Clostridium sp. B9]|uniref:hypothetical protein n=1 Tax=Clostridium sp. B9 TaxID=3423224 RepID=UPI003D2EC7DA